MFFRLMDSLSHQPFGVGATVFVSFVVSVMVTLALILTYFPALVIALVLIWVAACWIIWGRSLLK